MSTANRPEVARSVLMLRGEARSRGFRAPAIASDIGPILDPWPSQFHKPLKSLALPRGLEPLFSPWEGVLDRRPQTAAACKTMTFQYIGNGRKRPQTDADTPIFG